MRVRDFLMNLWPLAIWAVLVAILTYTSFLPGSVSVVVMALALLVAGGLTARNFKVPFAQ